MNEKERLFAILANINIEGLNPDEAVARFAGNPVLYFKIIKTFVDSMGGHLDKLRTFAASESTIEDYGIEVHGLKGSCYSISANKEGDFAKSLEMAAKAGDFATIAAGNEPFIQTMEALVEKLHAALAQASDGEDGGEKKASLDKEVLKSMLEAAKDFDADAMQVTIKKLEKYEYETGGDLVSWLTERVTAFAYDEIVERLEEIL